MVDLIHKPPHYRNGVDDPHLEPYVFARKHDLPFPLACALKYIVRCRYKGKFTDDLDKAVWYIRRYQEEVNGEMMAYFCGQKLLDENGNELE